MNGDEMQMIQVDASGLSRIAFATDSKRVAALRDHTTLSIWDALEGRELQKFQISAGFACSMALGPGGRKVAVGRHWGVDIWDTGTMEKTLTLDGLKPRSALAFSSDGERLAFGTYGGTVGICDLRTQRESVALTNHKRLCALAFSPDGKRLASASANGTIKIWETKRLQQLLTLEGYYRPEGVAFGPDAMHITSLSCDLRGVLERWSASTIAPKR